LSPALRREFNVRVPASFTARPRIRTIQRQSFLQVVCQLENILNIN